MQNHKKSRYSLRPMLIAFLLICVFVTIFCIQYYFKLQTTIRQESTEYLQEVSIQISNNIDRIIYDNFAALNSLATMISTRDGNDINEITPVIKAQKHYWKYENIMLIDRNGTGYDSSGAEIQLNPNSDIMPTLVNHTQSLSMAQMVNGKERIIFAVPVKNTAIEGKNMVAVAASYEPTVFDQAISMTAFEGEAYAQIIEKNGTVVTRPTLPSALKTGYNFINSIEDANFDSDSSIEKLKKDIDTNTSGQISFTLNYARVYMVYTPINAKNWYLLTVVPVEIVNARSDMLLQLTVLICGVIILTFAGLFTFLLYTYERHKRKLEQIAYVDDITEGNTIQKFYELVVEALTETGRPNYAMVYTNMAKFKVLNEQFGRNICDMILQKFYNNVSTSLHGKECIGRQAADNFCILMEYENETVLRDRLIKWYDRAESYVLKNRPVWSLPITEFGVYIITDLTVPITQMIDWAKLSIKESPQRLNNKLHYGIYDDKVRHRLLREKQLEDRMEQAMEDGEFQMYLQPKYHLPDEQIEGAEALVRWASATEGMIYPDEFIPLFEKNGFVIQVDHWIFEEACRTLRRWLDLGLRPIKISVNCSQLHLRNTDFLEPYRKLAQAYRIPAGLLEIELTETIVMENAQHLSKVINEIHKAGFGCAMDDFGSGYSSLNLIQSIPVDTLKLDRIFFNTETEDSSRMEAVVNSIVDMAKALSMKTVAEGVEYRHQVEMLRRMNCDFIQGYVFSKPVPVSEFEEMAFNIKQGGTQK